MKITYFTLILFSCIGLATSVEAATPNHFFQNQHHDEILISQGNDSSLTLGEAADLISRWLEAKSNIFSSPFDRQILAELTTGKLYSDTVQAMNFLINNNGYYEYGVQKVESVERFAASGNKATIEVRVTEDTTFYQNGKVVESTFNTKLVRYSLENWDGIWKIANSQILN